MNLQAPKGREEYRFDLTRWNRAGLSHFEYVDGDASVWLEELRIVMLGLYGRGLNPADRTPEKWRDLFMKPPVERQLTTSAVEFEASSVWKDLFTPFPVDVETAGKRNQRLLEQYRRQSPDYAWETMRAFARAVHIALGHLDAYANEGYLRTATQWDNLRKLAAMVNYQPTPPASATTTIALELEPDKGVIEIARGLAMKFAPPEGGAPLIFETLKPVLVHPELSGARTKGWNYNTSQLVFTKESTWIVPEEAELAQGDLAIITQDIKIPQSFATSLKKIERDDQFEHATLTFNDLQPDPVTGFSVNTGNALLLTEPDGVQLGLPNTTDKQIVIKIPDAANYSPGSIVKVTPTKNGLGVTTEAVVLSSEKGLLTLETEHEFSGAVNVQAYTPYAVDEKGKLETDHEILTLYYISASGGVVQKDADGPREFTDDDDNKFVIAQMHSQPENVSGFAYAKSTGRSATGRVVKTPSFGKKEPERTVRFEGSPPKSLEQGVWYVARPIGTSNLTPLRVSTIRQEADVYYIEFHDNPPADPDKTEFFGPTTRTLRPINYNRDQNAPIVGGVAELEGLSAEARNLVKAGEKVIAIFDKDEPPKSALAVLTSVEEIGSTNTILKITMEIEEDVSDWKAGWTKFYLNTVDISHGETKDPKVLGSGDAEKDRQNFQFKITEVSFIPSNTASTGVAPDLDVTVDGIKWEFRDIGDPTAEGNDAWSVTLNEDDTLQIHFRRRLPTGSNNLSVTRHRVGVGAKGTGVPSWSMTKPMKKNRFVTGIVQPFITSGGASREPVSDIRDNAPSHLAANGRAVSLIDFERLCKRHSSVWQAKAREIIRAGAINQVDIVIVPANGGEVGPTLENDLLDFIVTRALPNTRVTISNYQSLDMHMHVKIYVDTSRYEKSDVKAVVEAGLANEFALFNRALGQPMYVAEILAAMERIEGVSSATVTDFSKKSSTTVPLREARIDGKLVALFPTEEQVAVLDSIADVTVDVEILV
ncbi:MAG: hypothetical protein NPIRA02_09670 [Nitrospirales bacterium]|nr:MAG: hypothetical protein NPIRA02_09670 [Nitrospirales bacterium]